MKKNIIKYLYDIGKFSYLDLCFSKFILELDNNNVPEAALAAALLSMNQRQGHICLDLLDNTWKNTNTEKSSYPENVQWPDIVHWIDALKKSSAVGNPGDYAPLILDNKNRIYLYRYWEYQEKLAKLIQIRVNGTQPKIDTVLLKKGLNKLFPDENSKEINWQKIAAFTALTHNFCVISGGPGTGKTTTVSRILELLKQQPQGKNLRIAFAAPTGKAAARLQEAVSGQASTIHRLLKAIPDSPYFRYNTSNPLPVDVLVVDEASMVDMALMSKLIQALYDNTRIILLGDKDQLASVEAGAVLGDICGTGNVHNFSSSFCSKLKQITGQTLTCTINDVPAVCDSIVLLQKSYRFGDKSNINHISREINAGNAENAIKLLQNNNKNDIIWKKLPPISGLKQGIWNSIVKGFKDYLKNLDKPEKAFQYFDQFCILCALRQGPYGAVAVNQIAEKILYAEKLINPSKTWYKGRPVLITKNDYHVKLFNGDIGITLLDADNKLKVFFSSNDGGFRKLNPIRVPEHETVFAMTVHKSQGSEFNHVMLILPDRDSPVLTKELLYTGITRTISSLEIWGVEKIFKAAISRSIMRTSGLCDALWET